jgi:hypothetical protein
MQKMASFLKNGLKNGKTGFLLLFATKKIEWEQKKKVNKKREPFLEERKNAEGEIRS